MVFIISTKTNQQGNNIFSTTSAEITGYPHAKKNDL